jgi:hypothetical protein
MNNPIIGKVSATQQCPSSSDDFTFWLGDDEVVSPFDLVTAENAKDSISVGVIQDIHHVTESPSHIANYVASDFGNQEIEPMTSRLGTFYVSADVMNNDKEIYMPLQDGKPVRFATEDEIRQALGIDNIPQERRIPVGYLQQSSGVSVPVALDSAFLIGPEGAHLNVSGISGLATKTSFIMFLLQAIMQSQSSQKTATIIFNVKGDDLLFIDKPANDVESVKNDWEKCHLQAKPFENVRYYFPYTKKEDKGFANTWCDTETVQQVCKEGRGGNYIYTYKHDKEKLDLLLSNIDDPNMTIESIQNAIMTENAFDSVTDWRNLLLEVETRCRSGQNGNKSITVQSWRRFQRLLSTMIKGGVDGVFQDDKSGRDEKHHVYLSDEIEKIKGGETVVVDIAQLPEQQKCLVFGDVIRTVYKMKTDGNENCPDKIVIFVDELNKYAPSEVSGSPIINSLIEITERGRSLGIVLFSAEQFRSAIHKRVKGNCATNVYGRTNGIEIATGDYKYLPKSINSIMTRLPKGQLIVQHPIFRSLLKIAFPKPAYLQPEH